ncbi:MAG TPA: endolytic transglycosylase MltG [Polyangiaceae bacterium]|nr:endolytic transglycosylase MltG [Polyangiaceae bacterium]
MAALVVLAVGWGVFSLSRPHRGSGRAVEVVWPEGTSPKEGAPALVAAQVLDDTLSVHLLFAAAGLFVRPEPGVHLLADDLTPVEILRRLGRLSSRAGAKVVIPEGFNRFQIAARLEQMRVCSRAELDRAASDASFLAANGIGGDSAEGYLAPATYDLFCDTSATVVASELVETTRKRLATVRESHQAEIAGLVTRYGWGERDILTLASVVEKEAANADERPVIASVFFNRLDDPTFRPVRSLQSDPTAAYGCVVAPSLPSCSGYAGRVTPAMLRDPSNPYNTYRHPGLPPGPIANPGLPAILAVLLPASTDYLFFVSSGDGRHVFSRTLGEHEAAIHRHD